MKRILLALLLVIMIVPAAWAKVNVFVSILPQAYFVERIGGQEVNVQVLVGPGQSHETYEPTPKQMAQLAQADVYFPIGMPFEFHLMEKIKRSFKDLNVVESQRGISLRGSEEHHHDGHRPEFNIDPHIWLDPQKARIMSFNMTDELARLRPNLAEMFRANLARLAADLDQLHRDLTAQLKPYQGRSFMVFHPAYGYFAEAYGLRQIAVEAEGKSPNAKQLAGWIDLARREKVKAIFVQPQFSQDTARTIAASIGGVIVPLDPLAKDYLNNLRKMATAIVGAMP
ncbi:MAG TPA: zinc ABC transporter substrate-binding protein [bacterium]|nr:zinc ABC transporter substrate-binding protein [bacterium]